MKRFILPLFMFAACGSNFAMAAEEAPAKKPGLINSSRFVIGPSAPTNLAYELQEGIDLVRLTGGEYLDFTFLDSSHQNISSQIVAGLVITAYSKSGRGAVYVHDVRMPMDDEPAGLNKLDGMLKAGQSVKFAFPKPISVSEMVFQLEGYGDDDASVAIDIYFTKKVAFSYSAVEDYVNPPDSDDGGGDGGGGESYRDQCFSSPGHFGCSDRGPGSLYDQAGCEASPGSFNCQGG